MGEGEQGGHSLPHSVPRSPASRLSTPDLHCLYCISPVFKLFVDIRKNSFWTIFSPRLTIEFLFSTEMATISIKIHKRTMRMKDSDNLSSTLLRP